MPPRTNSFQKLVVAVHALAEDGRVEESVMLPHRETGTPREVDVVVYLPSLQGEILIGIEAADRGRPVDVGWVEQLSGKHSQLPTDALILYSKSGFTGDALTMATKRGHVAVSAEDPPEEFKRRIVGGLEVVNFAKISTSAESVHLRVQQANSSEEIWLRAPDDLALWIQQGENYREVPASFPSVVNGQISASLAELHGERFKGEGRPHDPFESTDTYTWDDWTILVEQRPVPVFLRCAHGPEPRWDRVLALRVRLALSIVSSTVRLEHLRLGKTDVAVADVVLDGERVLGVAGESRGRQFLSCVRVGPAR